MSGFVQPRALIVGIGDFGLWVQTHLWKHLAYGIKQRNRNKLGAARPDDVLSFLSVRVSEQPASIYLARPVPERWDRSDVASWNECERPTYADCEKFAARTMKRLSVADLPQPLRRSVIFQHSVRARTRFLQYFQDALVQSMGDSRLFDENLVHVTAYVFCDATELYASAMLWPVLVVLRQVLDSYRSSELISVINTASFAPAPVTTLHRAVGYITLREIELLSTWDITRPVPDFLDQLLSQDKYWRAQLTTVPFDRCYLMDNEKWNGAITLDSYDVIVSLVNSMEVTLLTNAATQIRDQLSTSDSFFRQEHAYNPVGQIQVADLKDRRLFVDVDRPYRQTKLHHRRGIYSSWGAASVCLPVQTLERWGQARFYHETLERYFLASPGLSQSSAQPTFRPSATEQSSTTAKYVAFDPQNAFEKLLEPFRQRAAQSDVKLADQMKPLRLVYQPDPVPFQEPRTPPDPKEWSRRIEDERKLLAETTLGLVNLLTGAVAKETSDDDHAAQQGDTVGVQTGSAGISQPEQSILLGWIEADLELICLELATTIARQNSGLRTSLGRLKEVRSDLARHAQALDRIIQDCRKKQLMQSHSSTKADQVITIDTVWHKWSSRPNRSAILVRFYLIIMLILQAVWQLGQAHPNLVPWWLPLALAVVLIPAALLGAGIGIKHGETAIENDLNLLRDPVYDFASDELTIKVCKALKEHFYTALDRRLDSIGKHLLAVQQQFNANDATFKDNYSQVNKAQSHFLRTTREIDDKVREPMYMQWSRATREDVENQPLLEAHEAGLLNSLKHLVQLPADELPPAFETAESDRGWCTLVLDEIARRIENFSGIWFDGSFELEAELLTKSGSPPEKFLGDLYDRARPFVAVDEDAFDQETSILDFVSLRAADRSNAIAPEAINRSAIPVSSFDPFTITYLRTVHGLNLFMLPFTDRYRQEYQMLSEQDWKQLVLDSSLSPEYEFAERVKELQLDESFLSGEALHWQEPESE